MTIGDPQVAHQKTNAARGMLEVLLHLKSSNRKNNVAKALASAMPFAEEAPAAGSTPESLDLLYKTYAPLRIFVLSRTVRELLSTVKSTPHIEPNVASKALNSALSMFTASSVQLDGGAPWFHGTITDTMLDAFRTMAHALPLDRHDVVQEKRLELIVALAALRATAVDPNTAPAVGAVILKIISLLEEAIAASYADGQEGIVDVMMKWKRHHENFVEVLSVNLGENSAEIQNKYHAVCKTFADAARGAIDDISRVISLTGWGFALIGLSS